MSTLKKIILIGVILIMVGLIGSLFTVKSLFTASELIKDEHIIDKPYENININFDNMSVKLYGSHEKETKILTSTIRDSNTSVQINDGVLNVTVNEPASFPFTISKFGFMKDVPSMKIYLPDEVFNQINIKSLNGMITADDIEANEITVNTINGLVKLGTIQSSKTMVFTENGKIELSHINGDIVSESTNGLISYRATHIDQNIDFKTVNGLISIRTDNDPTNVTFDVAVELGQVDIFGSNKQNSVYGDGENLIKLTTSLGKITVQ